DISQSSFFGSTVLKSDIMAQVASVLTLVATYGKDMVSLLLFSDRVEQYIPPGRGINHAHTIMNHLFMVKPQQRLTSLKSACEYLARLKRRDCIVFLISDFIDEGFDKPLRSITQHYDLIAVRCLDAYEEKLPVVG